MFKKSQHGLCCDQELSNINSSNLIWRKDLVMRFSFFVVFAVVLSFCVVSNLMADRIFYDNFESRDFTINSWTPKAVGMPDFEISADYNFTPGGKTCLKLAPTVMQDWRDMWHTFDKVKPAHVIVRFYERGWKNNIKVDQQYILIGDGTTDEDSPNFCQIGQTGNSEHDGHYSIFDSVANVWIHTKTTTDEPGWKKFEFILYDDGTAKVFVDDTEEYTFTQKWPHLGTVGFASYARNDRGGSIDGYWDDAEVYNTSEVTASSAVNSASKLTVTWGGIKSNK